MTTTTYLNPEFVYEMSRDYVTEVFPGDHDKRTCAVGFLNDDGTQLAQSVSNPDTIIAIAHRLIQIADEIRENQAQDRLAKNGIVSIDDHRGPNGPSMDV